MLSQKAKRQHDLLNEEVHQKRGRMGIRKQERGTGNSQDDIRGRVRTTAVQQAEKVTKPDYRRKSRLWGVLYGGDISKKILECINYLIDYIL